MTWFRVGGGSGIPATLKNRMNAVLNKKFGTAINYPPNTWPEEVNLLGALEEKTVSGAIAVIEDGADDVPTKSVKITIPASLSGVSAVSEVQTGRNLFDKSSAVFGSINASTGGDINSSTRLRSPWIKLNPSTQYTLSTNNNTLQVYELYQYTSDKTKIRSDRADAQSYTFTTTATTVYMRVIFRHADNSAPTLSELDNTQLEVGSTAHDYEQYDPTNYTASLGRTIHGGEVDIVNGEGQENCTNRNLVGDGFTWSYNTTELSFPYFTIGSNAPNKASNKNFVCEGYVNNGNYRSNLQDGEIGVFNNTTGINRFCVRDDSCTSLEQFLEKNANTKITYEVTTPTDFTFTGQEVPTRLGYNAFWSDSGDTEVTYRASGTVYNYPAAESEEF